ncbi:hypothetical protein CHS0354_000987 [Potamilus streckersoni]|uniref:Sushi domain-containing protein n=1 Tax=Potamilus streckersoni TaxID=2493646 RepID=A0AAE0VX19_9BIVA|nr:hypothetical protein CHS0354_000987 [Potamilus streckersoni]
MNQTSSSVGSVKCPDIAEPQEILTQENLDNIAVDNYNVTPGSVVNIGCLSKESHTLSGTKTLTCLDTGQWNYPLPKCLPKSLNDNVQFTSQLTNGTRSAQNLDLERFPLIVGLSLLGLACVFITIILAYLIYTNRRIRRQKKHTKYQSPFAMYNIQTISTVENLAETRDQLNWWRAFDIDTSYHVPSTSYHVPSSSDCNIESLRFTYRRDSWSGY